MSLWPTLLFTNLSISSRKITVSHQSFTVLTDFNNFLPTTFTHNFYPQYFHRFPQIFTDLHRFILPFSLYFLAIFYLAPSLQDLHKSSTDLSKIFQNFPSSIPFHLVPGQSVIPAHSPVFHRSSQIFTDLSCHSASIYPLSTRYSVSKIFTDLPQIFQRSFKNFPSSIPFHLDLDSRSFRPTLQISKFSLSSLISTVHHRSLTDLPKLLFFLHPLLLGIWTVGHSGPLSRSPSFSFPPFSLHFVADPPQVFQNSLFLYPLLLLSGQLVIPAHSPVLQVPPFPLLSLYLFTVGQKRIAHV